MASKYNRKSSKKRNHRLKQRKYAKNIQNRKGKAYKKKNQTRKRIKELNDEYIRHIQPYIDIKQIKKENDDDHHEYTETTERGWWNFHLKMSSIPVETRLFNRELRRNWSNHEKWCCIQSNWPNGCRCFKNI